MGAAELFFLVLLLLKGGSKLIPGAPTQSAPTPAPALPAIRTPPAATAPPPGQASTPQQAHQATQAASVPAPFPQVVPSNLPPFPGPGWGPFIPTPSAVVTRAVQLLPVLWARGVGTKQVEQTAGTWTTYVAAAGPAGRKDVHAFKLMSSAPALANA